jgi:hypothetical protein
MEPKGKGIKMVMNTLISSEILRKWGSNIQFVADHNKKRLSNGPSFISKVFREERENSTWKDIWQTNPPSVPSLQSSKRPNVLQADYICSGIAFQGCCIVKNFGRQK